MIWKLNGYIFLIKHDDLLSKYNAIWDKISTDAKIDLNSKPVYKNVYGDKARDFHNKEVPKVDSDFAGAISKMYFWGNNIEAVNLL